MPAELCNALLIHTPRAGNGGRHNPLDAARRILAAAVPGAAEKLSLSGCVAEGAEERRAG